ncbi:MAG: hypothetical protein FJ280_02445 [Planctomycetes bacterium]|nr:hypothetical protein [Planctomycetota bacterium]
MNTVLDLATGQLLAGEPMQRDPQHFAKLGKGDLVYEHAQNRHGLLCLRGTRLQRPTKGGLQVLTPDVTREGFVVHFIEHIPTKFQAVTAEGRLYEITVMSMDNQACTLVYRPIPADQGTGGGALGEFVKGDSAVEAGIAPHGVNIYLLADENTDLKTARAKPLAELVLRPEPWIAAADIERYDLSTHALYLKSPKPLPFERVALAGNPFVVTADGQRCYLGSLWTNISSYLPEPGTPVIDASVVSFDTPLPPDVIRIQPPGGRWPPGAAADDVRQDPRIVRALAANGQLHAGVEIHLDRVEVLPRDGGSSVRYTYTLHNKDTDNLYVLDPDKTAVKLFRFLGHAPFPRSTRGDGRFPGDADLPGSFEPPGQLDMAWFSLLPSGTSMTRTVTLPAYAHIPPDRYLCSFRFNSPGRLATKDKRERTEGRIWVGQVEASLTLDVEPGASTAGGLELRMAPLQGEVVPGVMEECAQALTEGRAPADRRYL